MLKAVIKSNSNKRFWSDVTESCPQHDDHVAVLMCARHETVLSQTGREEFIKL